MNIDSFLLRRLQYCLENLESNERIFQGLAQERMNDYSDYIKGIAWGMDHVNESYAKELKKLRSIIEEMGKGSLYLVEDVRLDGGEKHA